MPEVPLPNLAPVDRPLASPGRLPGDTGTHTVLPEEAGWRLDLFLTRYTRNTAAFCCATRSRPTASGRRERENLRIDSPGQTVTFTLPELPASHRSPKRFLWKFFTKTTCWRLSKTGRYGRSPFPGHWSGTLVSALAFKYDELSSVRGPERPGIVHRLDRDTSGVILIAKNNISHAKLAEQFQTKKIHKEYFAIVSGVPAFDRDIVDLPIGHHPKNREKMMIARNDPEAKSAVTQFEVLERFRGFSTIRALPQTGRTHQIRVHLAHVGTPVLCDKLYGGFSNLTLGEIVGNGCAATARRRVRFRSPGFVRQALHARRLTFLHPETGKEITVESPIPDDMQKTLEAIRKYR